MLWSKYNNYPKWINLSLFSISVITFGEAKVKRRSRLASPKVIRFSLAEREARFSMRERPFLFE